MRNLARIVINAKSQALCEAIFYTTWHIVDPKFMGVIIIIFNSISLKFSYLVALRERYMHIFMCVCLYIYIEI